jgi:hypothetical protein
MAGAYRWKRPGEKTEETSLGFFEQAIAAPSMKTALKAWGAGCNIFHQGAAREATILTSSLRP